MKTDRQIYTLLAAGPELLCALTGGLWVAGPYRFESLEVKGLERRTDGVLRPADPHAPLWVIEFQAQRDPLIYHRLVQKMALLAEMNLGRTVRGLLIFTSDAIDPRSPPWYAMAGSGADAPLRVVYLQKVLEELAATDPTHPLLAVFLPYRTGSQRRLREQGPPAYRRLQQADIPEPQRQACLAVFSSWFAIRFKELTYEEIMRMFGQMPPLEETRAYKELVAIGEMRGEAKLLGRQLQRRFGELPVWVQERLQKASPETLETWGEAVLEARTLDEVFGKPVGH